MSNAAWRLWIAMLSGNVSVFTAPFMNYSKTLHSARYLLFPPPFFPPPFPIPPLPSLFPSPSLSLPLSLSLFGFPSLGIFPDLEGREGKKPFSISSSSPSYPLYLLPIFSSFFLSLPYFHLFPLLPCYFFYQCNRGFLGSEFHELFQFSYYIRDFTGVVC